MSKASPLVSIIINSHNGENFISRSVNSALSQNYKNFEIIFYDNNSTDDTKTIIDSFGDCRIKYVKSNEFLSLGQARNNAINYSSGSLIGFLDVDDEWSKDKLEMQVPAFYDESVGLVISNGYISQNNLLKPIYRNPFRVKTGYVFKNLFKDYFISLPTVLLRRDALNDNKFNENYSCCEEADVFLRISIGWKIAFINKMLATYYIHDASYTSRNYSNFVEESLSILSDLVAVKSTHSAWIISNASKFSVLISSSSALANYLIQQRNFNEAKYYMKYIPFSNPSYFILLLKFIR